MIRLDLARDLLTKKGGGFMEMGGHIYGKKIKITFHIGWGGPLHQSLTNIPLLKFLKSNYKNKSIYLYLSKRSLLPLSSQQNKILHKLFSSLKFLKYHYKKNKNPLCL